MLSGHSSVLKLNIHVQIGKAVQQVVLAAKGITSFGSLIEELTLTGGL